MFKIIRMSSSANLTTTTNVSRPSSCSIAGNSKAGKVGFTFACCLILVVSLAGNSLIAIIVYKTKSMRKTINYFIPNMAVSDLLFPVFIFPLIFIELHDGFGVLIGHLEQIFCKVRIFLVYFSCCVSVESYILIAVERFVAVVFPLRASLFNSKLCPFFILGTWFVSTALSFPVLFGYNPVEYPRKIGLDLERCACQLLLACHAYSCLCYLFRLNNHTLFYHRF